MATKTLAERNNNPFALIDKTPDKWIGLTGTTPNGFLIFDTVLNGLRAGFINLKNSYFKPDYVTTTREIFPKYLGTEWGKKSSLGDDPIAYAGLVKKFQGIGENDLIKWNDKEQMVKLAKAIIQVEAGKLWVKDADIRKAYDMANGGKVSSSEPVFIMKADADESTLLLVGTVVVSGVVLYIVSRNNS